jgi:ATP-dependent DNA ligase
MNDTGQNLYSFQMVGGSKASFVKSKNYFKQNDGMDVVVVGKQWGSKYRTSKYSDHLKTGPSGFRMVIFQTKFGSGFKMALAAILLKKNIQKLDKKSPVLEWFCDFVKTIRKPDHLATRQH